LVDGDKKGSRFVRHLTPIGNGIYPIKKKKKKKKKNPGQDPSRPGGLCGRGEKIGVKATAI